MLYVIIAEDKPNSLPDRLLTRPAHLQRIQALMDENRLVIAGPNPAIDAQDPGQQGFTGSVIIAEFSSLDEATRWADNDPYTLAGVFQSVTVKPFKKVLP